MKEEIASPDNMINGTPKVAGCRNVINADLIVAGLSPLAPEKELLAARAKIFLHEIEEYISAGEDFAFETTLSGRSYLRLINRVRTEGWRVELIYLALPDVEMSKMRVAERVAHGGHDIPSATLSVDFRASVYNHSIRSVIVWIAVFVS